MDKKNTLREVMILVSIFVGLALFPLILPTAIDGAERWKEAYVQGQKFLEASKWEEAIRSFQDALKSKDQDDKSIRLYGMRFGYFPHRDKGIAHYHLGQWEEAIKDLKLSIEQSKTKEAVEYLDLAEKALKKSQEEARIQTPEGKNWREFYLEGLKFMESEKWHDALRAFEKAIQLKDKDDESLKLYGLRYGYFPHREKGIVHYWLEEWEQAVQELETSLAQAPSAIASEYLDLAKNRKITVTTSSVFRGNWWNHYERGNLLAERGAWEQALEDYQKAIEKQDKNIKDAFRVRTYGLRFIDYFPHRELGVAYYQTGQFEKAIQELETSLSMTYTAKAAFFLNQARREFLKTSGIVDTTPPRITLPISIQGSVTNLFSVEVNGVAEDENFVSAVWINDRLLFIELAEKKLSFHRSVPLTNGENKITVTAADLAGNKTSETLTLRVDREGPMIVLDDLVDGETTGTADITLKGLLVDETGILELAVNDQTIRVKRNIDIEFSQKLNLQEGINLIKIRAKDTIGNTTEDVIHLTYDPTLKEPKPKKTEGYQRWWAQKPIFWEKAGFFDGFNFQNIKLIPVSMQNPHLSSPQPFTIRKVAARPPVVKLKDLGDEQVVFLEKFFIEGKVIAIGSAQVDVILINDEPLEIKPGKSILFSHLAELKEGENLFKVVVIDTEGNETEKEIKVIRRVPKVNQVGSRMTLAVLPFEQKGQVSDTLDLVYDGLIKAFVEQERFNVVGRKGELEAALAELKLSETGLVDESTALKLGKIVAAEALVMGSIAITDEHIEVIARLVNAETTEILASKDVYDQYRLDKLLEKIDYLMEGLALKFNQEFPLVSGEVIKVEGPTIIIDLGKNHQIRKDMKFIVFREGEVIKHPDTGKILGADTEQLCEARIEQVAEDFSKGEVIIKLTQDGAIKPLDKVITK